MRTETVLLAALLALAVAAGCTKSPEPLPGGPKPAAREQGPGTATLRWSALAPEAYARDVPDPVAGFRIYLGPTPDALKLEAVIDDPKATSHVVKKLARGKHYYAVTTYTRLGIESEQSQVVSKEVE